MQQKGFSHVRPEAFNGQSHDKDVIAMLEQIASDCLNSTHFFHSGPEPYANALARASKWLFGETHATFNLGTRFPGIFTFYWLYKGPRNHLHIAARYSFSRASYEPIVSTALTGQMQHSLSLASVRCLIRLVADDAFEPL